MMGGGIAATSAGGTAVQLVTPFTITTNFTGPDSMPIPPTRGAGILHLVRAAPEPGRAAVGAVALATLGALGVDRRLRHRT
jgi:hypothetical protein